MDIGMVGLGVMGRNLALNMADHGFSVIGFDLSAEAGERFERESRDEPGRREVSGTSDIDSFVRALDTPRRAVLLVPAGKPTDAAIDSLLGRFEPGDVIIDGGNTRWPDTERRIATCAEKGVHFLGSGVSGGEVGARFGPSLMPGGPREAWDAVKPIWEAIAAKVASEA